MDKRIKLNKQHPLSKAPLQLYQHQSDCVEFALNTLKKQHWFSLVHDAGLGKTATLIATWINLRKKHKNLRLVVSCPACTLKDVWEEHIRVWLPENVSLLVVDKTTKLAEEQNYDVILITRNIVARAFVNCWKWEEKSVVFTDAAGRTREKGSFVERFPSKKSLLFKSKHDYPFLFVIDESHYLRNYGERKVCLQAHHEISKNCKFAIINTATPVCNRPEDVAAQLYSIAVDIRGKGYDSFSDQDVKDTANPKKWKIGKYVIAQIPPTIFQNNSHRKTEDILKLPKILRRTFFFELQLNKKHARIYNHHLNIARQAKASMKEGADKETMLELLNAITKMRQMVVHPKLEKHTAKGLTDSVLRKIAASPSPMLQNFSRLIHFLQTKKNHDKIIVFGLHTNSVMKIAIQRIQQDSPSTTCSLYSGALNQKQRSDIVKHFLAPSSKKQILFIQMIAGGVGLNLVPGPTAAVFIQQSWNPMDHLQAYKRIHRIGQNKNVEIYNIVCKDTPDFAISKLHKDKIKAADAVNNADNLKALNDKPWRTQARAVDLCSPAAIDEDESSDDEEDSSDEDEESSDEESASSDDE